MAERAWRAVLYITPPGEEVSRLCTWPHFGQVKVCSSYLGPRVGWDVRRVILIGALHMAQTIRFLVPYRGSEFILSLISKLRPSRSSRIAHEVCGPFCTCLR